MNIISKYFKCLLRLFVPYFIKCQISTLFHIYKYNLQVPLNSYISHCSFEQKCVVGHNCVLENSLVGSFTYITEGARVSSAEIGRFCSIGPNIIIGLGLHPSRDYVSTSPIFYSRNNVFKNSLIYNDDGNLFEEHKYINKNKRHFVKIGNDVWIGANVIISDGIEIGDGAIVGANSFVNRSIPPYAIFAGSPAKLIRFRFDERDIDFLMKTMWWNKPISWILENSHAFNNIKNLKETLGFN